MKSEELIKAIGDIDDKFVKESSDAEEQKTLVIKLPRAKTMKKWGGAIAAVLAVCIIGGALASGGIRMGSYKTESMDFAAEQEMNYKKSDMSFYSEPTASYEYSYAKESADEGGYRNSSKSASGNTSSTLLQSSVTSLGKENLKLIYTANMTVQTTDYAQAESDIKTLVENMDGYFESVSFDNGSYYSNSTYKYGYYSIRIPSEKYTDFITAVGDSCHVVNLSQSVQDVGEQYYEIEGRLETLYTKQARLQELLKTAANLTDIIQLESELSDTEYQIDSYKGSLKHYDSLIGYSTINLSLEQVIRTESGIEEDTSFGARIKRSFERGMTNVANTFEDFVLWISYNIVGIAIAVIIVICVIKFRPVTKIWKKIRKKNQ